MQAATLMTNPQAAQEDSLLMHDIPTQRMSVSSASQEQTAAPADAFEERLHHISTELMAAHDQAALSAPLSTPAPSSSSAQAAIAPAAASNTQAASSSGSQPIPPSAHIGRPTKEAVIQAAWSAAGFADSLVTRHAGYSQTASVVTPSVHGQYALHHYTHVQHPPFYYPPPPPARPMLDQFQIPMPVGPMGWFEPVYAPPPVAYGAEPQFERQPQPGFYNPAEFTYGGPYIPGFPYPSGPPYAFYGQ